PGAWRREGRAPRASASATRRSRSPQRRIIPTAGSRRRAGWASAPSGEATSSRRPPCSHGAETSARARLWKRLGREGGGTPALRLIPLESRHGGALVISDGCTHLAGDGQEQRDILGREPVIAALRKEEAVAGAAAECVDFVAHAAFTHVTHPAGAWGDGEGTDLDRWGCCGHLDSSSGGAGSCPAGWLGRTGAPLRFALGDLMEVTPTVW